MTSDGSATGSIPRCPSPRHERRSSPAVSIAAVRMCRRPELHGDIAMALPYQDSSRSVAGARERPRPAHDVRGEGRADARAVADPVRGRPAPAAPGRLHRRHGPGGREEGPGPRPGADLARAGQPRGRPAHRRARAQPAAEVPARGDPARDPRALARGVPGRPDGARRDALPFGARLRRDLEPGPRRARGAGDRARGAQRRVPPGAGAGARRLARRALGPHRGDAGRGSVPGGCARHPLRPRPAGRQARPAGDAQALRGPLLERGCAQPRAGAPRLARAQRRVPAPVRDVP